MYDLLWTSQYKLGGKFHNKHFKSLKTNERYVNVKRTILEIESMS